MADTIAPGAIRVTRPYTSEEELLENELDTFTRTSITLLGAPPRPPGLVLRFELLLSPGNVVVRGEGRVVGYKRDVYYGLGGLTLRFTRVDSRSKALIDKAAAMRERRRPSSKVPAPAAQSSPELPPLPPPLPMQLEDPLDDTAVTPFAPAVAPAAPPAPPSLPDLEFVPLSQGTMPDAPSEPAAAAPAPRPAALAPSAPRDRDALLDRLRGRSKALSPDAVRDLLERGRRR